MTFLARIAPAVLLLALLAGCPESLGQNCDPKLTNVGNFNLNLALQPSTGQCVVHDGGGLVLLPDGGSPLGNVATISASLCTGSLDGGPERLFLASPNQVSREGDLTPTGAVSFAMTAFQNVTQSPC
jgi:hypothetical protein